MGSVMLVMDFNGSFGLEMGHFEQYLNCRPDQLSLPCIGFKWLIWTHNGRFCLVPKT